VVVQKGVTTSRLFAIEKLHINGTLAKGFVVLIIFATAFFISALGRAEGLNAAILMTPQSKMRCNQ
jgi:uncharacterized membrane protein